MTDRLFVSFCLVLKLPKFLLISLTNADILRQRTKDNEVKKYCVSLLEKYGSFEYTRKKLVQLHNEASDEVKRFGGNNYMEEILNGLHIDRVK